jgi:hypothetical protein
VSGRRSTPADAEHTWDTVKGREAHRLVQLFRPWLAWAAMAAGGLVLHKEWSSWMVAGSVVAMGVLVGILCLHLTHNRSTVAARFLSPATALAAGIWLASADKAGVSHKVAGVWAVGGATFCVVWNIWLAVRDGDDHAGHPMAFTKGAEKAGFHGLKVISMKVFPHRAEARIATPQGQVIADDLQKATRYIEAGSGLPPGALTFTEDLDNASHVKVTISDPRVLRKPLPWPGPSRPGVSIAQPLGVGMWQDAEPVDYTVLNHHAQVMGSTGAGKTESQAWNEIAETITRHDAAVYGVDITKQRQFLGPLEEGLHGLVTRPEDLGRFFSNLHALVPERTNYLAEHGFGKWAEGCGLIHCTIQLEEVPDIITWLNDHDMYEAFESDVKAGRSGGIRFVFSLQRSDWTQMPTLIRGQLDKICLGVKDSEAAKFGLSDRQDRADCSPELWGDRYPGMAYIDSASIPLERVTMPMRYWFWGPDGENFARLRAHASQYPAAGRPADPLTAARLGGPAGGYLRGRQPVLAGPFSQWPPASGRPAVPQRPASPAPNGSQGSGRPVVTINRREEDTVRNSKQGHGRELDDAPGMWDDDGPEELQDDVPQGAGDDELEWNPDSAVAGFVFDTSPEPREMDAAEARAAVTERLGEFLSRGKNTFALSEVMDLLEVTGKKRTWLYWMFDDKLKAEGVLQKDGLASWRILKAL